MNFNLNFTSPFVFIKENFKSIMGLTWLLLGAGVIFIALFSALFVMLINEIMVIPAIFGILFGLVAFFVFLIYYSGFYSEVCHNFIKEGVNKLPTLKGRFKEYMAKGGKVFLLSLIPAILIVLSMTFLTPKNATLTFLAVVLINIIFVPFLMALVHNFEFKNVFRKESLIIFRNSIVESSYSISIPIILNYILQFILFVAILLIVLICLFLLGLLTGLFATGIITSIFIIVALIVFSIAAIYLCILAGVTVSIYQASLMAQTYNYGKYFQCMGEAPKRKPVEWLLPIFVLLVAFCIQLSFEAFGNKFDPTMLNKTVGFEQGYSTTSVFNSRNLQKF